jgi:hypothetical protein
MAKRPSKFVMKRNVEATDMTGLRCRAGIVAGYPLNELASRVRRMDFLLNWPWRFPNVAGAFLLISRA